MLVEDVVLAGDENERTLFEHVTLSVTELGSDDRIVRQTLFDPDARAAALAYLDAKPGPTD